MKEGYVRPLMACFLLMIFHALNGLTDNELLDQLSTYAKISNSMKQLLLFRLPKFNAIYIIWLFVVRNVR